MSTTFVTGGTGYLGGYTITELLRRSDERLLLLVRARSEQEAREKLWRGLQLHLEPDAFYAALDRIEFAYGDLHAPNLGFSDREWARLAERTDRVLHIAASLNRKSDKVCFNTNLRGGLSVIRFAREAVERGRLARFTHVSTTAVAGTRQSELVGEDEAIDWDRSDYDPYARTKKFAEHLLFELLPDVSKVVVRPPTVMGDSRRPETTEFEMTGVFATMARMPFVPVDPHGRIDIAPANYVCEAIARLHLLPEPRWQRYHASAGAKWCTTPEQIGQALEARGGKLRLSPRLEKPFELGFRAMNRWPRRGAVQKTGALLKVFWPYITYDTVFDNARVVSELGLEPTPFHAYCAELFEFVTRVGFKYPYKPLPSPAMAGARPAA